METSVMLVTSVVYPEGTGDEVQLCNCDVSAL